MRRGGAWGVMWRNGIDGWRGMCTPKLLQVPKPVPQHVVTSLREERRRRERLATFFRDVEVTTLRGEPKGSVPVACAVFDVALRTDILQRVVLWQQARKRKPTIAVKDRSEVSGGGRKPWQQKGTGRARHGSIRSPLWRGGGKAHARRGGISWEFKLPKKVRRLGLRVALSARMREGKLVIVDDLEIEEAKTALLKGVLESRGWSNALIIDESFPETFRLACNNIPNVDMLPARGANVYSVLKRRNLIISKKGLDYLHNHLLRLPLPKSD